EDPSQRTMPSGTSFVRGCWVSTTLANRNQSCDQGGAFYMTIRKIDLATFTFFWILTPDLLKLEPCVF
ncbi:MAG: hypothetical protein JSV14_13565, partial [Deltaproteobacteria bacterium]